MFTAVALIFARIPARHAAGADVRDATKAASYANPQRCPLLIRNLPAAPPRPARGSAARASFALIFAPIPARHAAGADVHDAAKVAGQQVRSAFPLPPQPTAYPAAARARARGAHQLGVSAG